ncbi:MAG: hypothetical protein GY855_17815 [candidate division Zixibacteria bacterium]|nr:hypothetical protein [candidate division Zixibacteria bacterium]
MDPTEKTIIANPTLDISIENYDGFKFVFNDEGLDLSSSGNTVLVEGQSGVGKTVLSLQMAINYLDLCKNSNEYVLYIAFEQPAKAITSLLKNFEYFKKTEKDIDYLEDYQKPIFKQGKLNIYSRPPSMSHLNNFIDEITREITSQPKCRMLLLDSIGVFENEEYPANRQQLDRLCEGARQGDYALIMVREKEPQAAAAVAEYVTDSVFELQFKPMNISLPYGPLVRTVEVKKSRIQKSHRGPHEFEIRGEKGIIVYPSIASIFEDVERMQYPKMQMSEDKDVEPMIVSNCTGSESIEDQHPKKQTRENKDIEPIIETIKVFDCPGSGFLEDQLKHFYDKTDSGTLRPGQSLLLYGEPGSNKTVLGFHFLKLALDKENEDVLFLTFKVNRRALDSIAYSYLGNTKNYKNWDDRLRFIDARQTFWTPARVLAEVRKEIQDCEQDGKNIKRAVIFGIGMIDRLPAFQGMELTFLQVIASYFESEGINATFIEWPQQSTTLQLQYDSIVNYFATAIKWNKDVEDQIQVIRHDYRVVINDPLYIYEEQKSNGLSELIISKNPKEDREIKIGDKEINIDQQNYRVILNVPLSINKTQKGENLRELHINPIKGSDKDSHD